MVPYGLGFDNGEMDLAALTWAIFFVKSPGSLDITTECSKSSLHGYLFLCPCNHHRALRKPCLYAYCSIFLPIPNSYVTCHSDPGVSWYACLYSTLVQRLQIAKHSSKPSLVLLGRRGVQLVPSLLPG